MTQSEKKQIHARLFSYKRYRHEVMDYAQRAIRTAPRIDATSGIRGSHYSDPTAAAGCALADPPKKLREKQGWMKAIESAWLDCIILDGGEKYGRAYMMEKNFSLTGKPHSREKNEDVREQIMQDCNISRSTFFRWLYGITYGVYLYAREQELI